MEFRRSLRVLPEGETEEMQINLLTSFIDASQVNDVDDDKMDNLRAGNGELKEGFPGHLPEGDENTCTLSDDSNDYCLLAGDSRTNAFPGLGAIHTVFLRQHNKLACGLKVRHPEWNSETIFQESRKIVGTLMQHITYTEYLPVIVGPDAVTKYDLGEDADYSYNPETDPTLTSVFSTAAFRFGHSTVPDALNINGQSVPIHSTFNHPSFVLDNLAGVVQGLLQEPTERVDRWYSTGMTDRMFESAPQQSFDIVALNIQRGRDHGIQPYNRWRDYCRFPEIQTFGEMGNSGNVYSRVYTTTDDIDLYSGALSEAPVQRSSVGETYACLIGLQFQALKYRDRFWYERNTSEGFTPAQLTEIKKMSLAGLLCDAFEDDLSIQPDVFRLPTENGNNDEIACGLISRMNLDEW